MRGAAVVMPAAPCFLSTNAMFCVARACQRCPERSPARYETRRTSFSAIASRSGSRRPRRAVARIALEEQGLTGDGRNHRRLERLRDQERRVRAFAGQEAFRIGGGKYHRNPENAQQLVDR